ncbi:class I SAM-dependent methyltransferase [Neptuniibacter sp. QD48_55]|uniref:class I SAM-dependent methyltransferase n=1 Tax=Neptuniibacter sp. QD48_55 TaxID=3398212 RepID=UPI0039F5EB6C
MSNAQQKWDQRYLAKSQSLEAEPVAPEYLQRQWRFLKTGRVLDLASGDGAASIFLAKQGFSPVATDISQVGLDRLSEAMTKLGLEVETAQLDLEEESVDLSGLGLFDSIVISRYKPADGLWEQLLALLKPEGTLLMTTFNLLQHERTGFSKRFCLRENELLDHCAELALVDFESDRHQSGMDSYIFKKESKK